MTAMAVIGIIGIMYLCILTAHMVLQMDKLVKRREDRPETDYKRGFEDGLTEERKQEDQRVEERTLEYERGWREAENFIRAWVQEEDEEPDVKPEDKPEETPDEKDMRDWLNEGDGE